MDKKLVIGVLVLVVIALGSFFFYRSQALKRTFTAEALKGLSGYQSPSQVLTEADIEPLPKPVQKYLRYVGVVGRPKVQNLRVLFEGEMKPEQGKDWMKISALQYSFIPNTTREFYINGKMFGLPVLGLHSYTPEQASMLIKVAGLIPVAEVRGREMELGETVTVFNDMCILAPASLIDKRISWETIDPLTVKATFDNSGRKISATLYFNETGELTNFVSDDRYMTQGNSLVKLRWSTQVRDYKDYNGVKLPSYGEAIWYTPQGEYTYARFNLKSVEYNVRSYQ